MPEIFEYSHHYHEARLSQTSESAAAVCVQNLSNWGEAIEEIKTWPEYKPQPLRTLSNQAKQLGINSLFVKDESRRFGTSLGSFKALGAPYAVYKILAKTIFLQTGTYPTSEDTRAGKYKNITERVTVCV